MSIIEVYSFTSVGSQLTNHILVQQSPPGGEPFLHLWVFWFDPSIVHDFHVASSDASRRGGSLCRYPASLGHRRLMARATVRMMPTSIMKGNQVFRKPAQLNQEQNQQRRQKTSSSLHIKFFFFLHSINVMFHLAAS